MPLSAKDIIDKVFRTSSKGYNKDEVDAFLDEIIEEYHILTHKIEALDSQLYTVKEKEAAKGQADAEYAQILESARVKADAILQEAQHKAQYMAQQSNTVHHDDTDVQLLQNEVKSFRDRLEYLQERVQAFVSEMSTLLDDYISYKPDSSSAMLRARDDLQTGLERSYAAPSPVPPGIQPPQSPSAGRDDGFSFDDFENEFVHYKDNIKDALSAKEEAPAPAADALYPEPQPPMSLDEYLAGSYGTHVPQSPKRAESLPDSSSYSSPEPERHATPGSYDQRGTAQAEQSFNTKPSKRKSFQLVMPKRADKPERARSAKQKAYQKEERSRMEAAPRGNHQKPWKATAFAPLEIPDRKPRPKPVLDNLINDAEFVIPPSAARKH